MCAIRFIQTDFYWCGRGDCGLHSIENSIECSARHSNPFTTDDSSFKNRIDLFGKNRGLSLTHKSGSGNWIDLASIRCLHLSSHMYWEWNALTKRFHNPWNVDWEKVSSIPTEIRRRIYGCLSDEWSIKLDSITSMSHDCFDIRAWITCWLALAPKPSFPIYNLFRYTAHKNRKTRNAFGFFYFFQKCALHTKWFSKWKFAIDVMRQH